MSRQSVAMDKRKSAELVKTIKAYMGRKNMNKKDLCKIFGCSFVTLAKRLETPDLFTRGELKTIIAILDIPVEEILPYII